MVEGAFSLVFGVRVFSLDGVGGGSNGLGNVKKLANTFAKLGFASAQVTDEQEDKGFGLELVPVLE